MHAGERADAASGAAAQGRRGSAGTSRPRSPVFWATCSAAPRRKPSLKHNPKHRPPSRKPTPRRSPCAAARTCVEAEAGGNGAHRVGAGEVASQAALKRPSQRRSPTNVPAPAPKPRVKQSQERTEEGEPQRPRRVKCAPPIRDAAGPNNGLLAGAQPVVPAGSFESPLDRAALTGSAFERRTPAPRMGAYVYVLGTCSKKRHLTYVGWTIDVARRSRSTMPARARAPRAGALWVLLHANDATAARQAMSREWHLKRDRAFRKKLALELKSEPR